MYSVLHSWHKFSWCKISYEIESRLCQEVLSIHLKRREQALIKPTSKAGCPNIWRIDLFKEVCKIPCSFLSWFFCDFMKVRKISKNIYKFPSSSLHICRLMVLENEALKVTGYGQPAKSAHILDWPRGSRVDVFLKGCKPATCVHGAIFLRTRTSLISRGYVNNVLANIEPAWEWEHLSKGLEFSSRMLNVILKQPFLYFFKKWGGPTPYSCVKRYFANSFAWFRHFDIFYSWIQDRGLHRATCFAKIWSLFCEMDF